MKGLQELNEIKDENIFGLTLCIYICPNIIYIQWVKKLPQCLCILKRLVLCEGLTYSKVLNNSSDILEHVGYLSNQESCDYNQN